MLSDTASAAWWRVVGLAAFMFTRPASEWSWWHVAGWAVFIGAAMEVLGYLVMLWGHMRGLDAAAVAIKKRGRDLANLEAVDLACILSSKLITAAFTHHVIQWAWTSPHVEWRPDQVGLVNTGLALLVCYLIYDLGYTLFHRALHWRPLYPWIHKHHHRNAAPWRGNTDAINGEGSRMGGGGGG
jgi:sterol desaturase/sphingolipid hydroxylase (fatty acid hydroxylase superfamily)